MRRSLAAAVTALAVVGAVGWRADARSAADTQDVSFAARDGVMVAGTLYLPQHAPAPGVVLLHMAGRTRQDWDTAGQALADDGIVALAIGFRPLTDETGGGLVADAEAALAYLATRPEVAATRLGMAGASLGANVAALAAARDPRIRSLVLLSPSLEYRGLKIEPAMKTYTGRPALLVASSEDPYALRTARTLVGPGDGLLELRVLAEAGHGTVMLRRQPSLVDAVVDWFLRTLL